jgi:hypothetical protein
VRSARKTAERLLLVTATCRVASDGSRRKAVRAWLKKEGVWNSASPSERRFLEAARSTAKERIDFSWKAEAQYFLAWALGLVGELQSPSAQTSARIELPKTGEPADGFLKRAKLRPAAEIEAATEALYQAHWSCRDAQRKRSAEPHGYDIEVVQERHRAANWLTGSGNADWDNVATDT